MTCCVDTNSALCPLGEGDINILNQIVGWGLVVGILASYLPQVLKIARTSAEGLSPSYVLLTAWGGMFLFLSRAFLDARVLWCCQYVERHRCVDGVLSLIQFSGALVGQVAVLAAFLLRQKGERWLLWGTRGAALGMLVSGNLCSPCLLSHVLQVWCAGGRAWLC